MGNLKRGQDTEREAEKRVKVNDGWTVTKTAELNGASLCSIDSDDNLQLFVEWCLTGEQKIHFSPKVHLGTTGSCARYGMSASQDIEEGEILFSIPKEKVLTWENLESADEIREDIEDMAIVSRWAPTVFTIMLEYLNPNTSWKPYLDLFFGNNVLDLPILWDESAQHSVLQGLLLSDRISKDRRKIEEDFTQRVFPALVKFGNVEQSSFANLLSMAFKVSAFIMSYSFTRPEPEANDSNNIENEDVDEDNAVEEQEATEVGNALLEIPVMVPVADFLNASISKNNAKLHWNEDDCVLTMIATKRIPVGEEVFNTYGEISNQEMLYLYGYAENDTANPFEEVFIPTEYLKEIVTQDRSLATPVFVHKTTDIHERWAYLEDDREAVGADSPIVLGKEGFLTEDDLHVALRVLRMTDAEFTRYSNQDNTEEADDFEPGTYSLRKLKDLPVAVRNLLTNLIAKRLSDYPRPLAEEEALLGRLDIDCNEGNSKRELWATFVRCSQLFLLHEYLDALK